MPEPTEDELTELTKHPRELAARWREAFLDMQAGCADARAQLEMLHQLNEDLQLDQRQMHADLTRLQRQLRHLTSVNGSQEIVDFLRKQASSLGTVDWPLVAEAIELALAQHAISAAEREIKRRSHLEPQA